MTAPELKARAETLAAFFRAGAGHACTSPAGELLASACDDIAAALAYATTEADLARASSCLDTAMNILQCYVPVQGTA